MKSPTFTKKRLALAVGAASLLAADISMAEVVLEEVLVTATRREQSVQDVPYNISAISSDLLRKANITGLGDLAKIVPGLNFNDRGSRSQMFSSGIIMRGMNTDRLARINAPLATVSPVSTYVGETPVFVNLELMDLDRVEVLRGPQGTLYGSGSLGGTIRYIQQEPSLDAMSGDFSVGLGSFEGADDLNARFTGILNLPISDTIALRLNASATDEAGFIDMPNLYSIKDGVVENADPDDYLGGAGVKKSDDDVNNNEVLAFRASLLIEPSDTFKAVLNYYYQSNESDGANIESYAFYGEGSQKSADYLASTYDGEMDIFSAEIEVDMGFATLVSATSYADVEGDATGDITGLYENFTWHSSYYGDYPRRLFSSTSTSEDTTFTQELRLVSNGGGAIDWVVGAFYQKNELDTVYEDRNLGSRLWHEACVEDGGATFDGACGAPHLYPDYDFANGVPVSEDLMYLTNSESEFEDLALFGELTFHISDQWQITGGLRAFQQDYETTNSAGVMLDVSVFPWQESTFGAIGKNTEKSDEDDVLFKANTSYDLNDDTMIYATWSEGFRRGGANGVPPGADESLQSYAPDTTENIELGIKGSFSDRVSYTFAVYDIDWEDIQINRNCGGNFGLCVVNAGDAESKGVETEINAQLSENFRLDFGYTYSDATITDPQTGGVEKGKELPGVPEHSGNATLWYETSTGGGLDITFMLNSSYRSETTSQVVESLDVEIDDYWLWNTSIAIGNESWQGRLFVNNIEDEEGYMSAYSTQNVSSHWGERAYALRGKPREIGFDVSYRF
jgi:outer membrane receptor protein involved in Fe transport